jgi:hypothetical protein
MKKPKILEKDVKASIKNLLDGLGIWHFQLTQGLGSYPGLPDRMAVSKGKVYAIEAKRPGGKQRPAQAKFQRLWEASYGKTYILAFGVDDVIDGMGLKDQFV